VHLEKRTLTRNVLPGIRLYTARTGEWLEDLRVLRTIRPAKPRKALRASQGAKKPRKKRAVILTKAETDALAMLTPAMRKIMGL